MNLPRTEIHCPVDGCDWSLDTTPPQVELGALSGMGDTHAMATNALAQLRREVEREVERHLDGHMGVEWAETVRRLRQERDALRAEYDQYRATLTKETP